MASLKGLAGLMWVFPALTCRAIFWCPLRGLVPVTSRRSAKKHFFGPPRLSERVAPTSLWNQEQFAGGFSALDVAVGLLGVF